MMNSPAGLPPNSIYCSKCWKPISKDAKYCQHCGAYQNYQYQQAALKQTREQWEIIKSIIIFYSIYLASVLPLFWIDDDKVAVGILVISGVDVLIILGYWCISRISILHLFHFDWKIFYYIGAGIFFLVPLSVINFAYHDVLVKFFGVEEIRFSEPFISAGFGFGVIVFSGCLMPAIWEEIAFRGLIQTGLSKKFRKWEVIFLTSALFAIIHITVLSWPYLFLVGVVLGLLRMHSQSLWPVIVVHFLHNFIVFYNEYYGSLI